MASNLAPLLRCVLFLCAILPVFSTSNILILPIAGEGSHYYVMKFIAKELVARGNDVTMLLNDNFKDLGLPSAEEGQDKRVDGDPSIHFEFYKAGLTMSDYEEFNRNMTNSGLEGKFNEFLWDLVKSDIVQKMMTECRDLLGNTELMLRLRNSNFDLVLVDNNMRCPVVQYLRKHMGIKFAVIVPTQTLPTNEFIENRSPLNPSYMPQYMTGLDHVLSFYDRMTNFAFVMFNMALSMYSTNAELGAEYGIPDVSFTDAEVWLVNNHFALDFPRPVLPNHVAVGGLTTHPSASLNSEWEEFLQSAGDEGAVLFSMGSYASGIDGDVAAMFAGAFAQLPQKVIWKLNGSPAAKLTPNVKVVDWIPQNDLLAHPQIKAFVYHCGMNGIWEAVYHGVPIVAVPLMWDQSDNAQRIVTRGMGVKVDIATLTSDKLAQAIRTVINDQSYKTNATKVSAIFRDKQRTPQELAADWVEYVIRHGGAAHLRSAALDLNIFQYLLLDVILTLLSAIMVFIILVICSCKLIFRGCRKVCGSSSKVKRE